MSKYWTPPHFFPLKFFYQNDSEWPEMDFKHNFKKYENLSDPRYEKFHTFFLNEGFPNKHCTKIFIMEKEITSGEFEFFKFQQ